MPNNRYHYILKLLKVVMYIKRLIFWIFGFFWGFVRHLNRVYSQTLGFYLYRMIEYCKRKIQKLSFTKQEGVLDLLGRRGVLQTVVFVVAIVIMIPHTKLYTRSLDEVAGRNTILYSLVGPGDQSYDFDEIIGDIQFVPSGMTDAWRQASLYAGDFNTALSAQNVYGPIEITGVVAGGSAFTKPVIMHGVDIGTSIDDAIAPAQTDRSALVYYEVEVGDVLGSIAQKFGISIETLMWANNLTARSLIRPGQRLTILPVDGVTHTVVSGDTISRIARVYGASAEAIVSHNDLANEGASIRIGQSLVVPGGVRPQPVVVPTRPIASRPQVFDQVSPPPSAQVPAGVGYIWPTAASIITQYYGWRHGGLDIAGPVGTAIYATRAGTVMVSQCGWNWGFGCYVQIDHGGGVQTLYAHASQLFVSVGDTVSQGQTIAAMGSTGNSSGPHLHFEIRVNGTRQNPLSYIRR